MNYDADNQVLLNWLVRKSSVEEVHLSWISWEENLRAKAVGKLRNPNREVQSKRQKLVEAQITKINENWQQRWNEFMAEYQDEDEIWEYSSPANEWEKLMGSEGYVRIRDGKILKILMLKMN